MRPGQAADNLRIVTLRALKFYTVGAAGVAVQLIFLAFFKSGLKLHYLAATALAVETAVVHNFFWHERWTWSERTSASPGAWLLAGRFARFNLTTGLISILSNLVLMRLFVGQLRIHYLLANGLTILTASLLNFLFSEYFVFRKSRG